MGKGRLYEKVTFNNKRKPCLGRHRGESCMLRREGPTESPRMDFRWGSGEHREAVADTHLRHNEPFCFVFEEPDINFLAQSVHRVGLER